MKKLLIFASTLISACMISAASFAGVSAEEYCGTLATISQNNDLSEGAQEGLVYGYNKAQCWKYGYILSVE